MALLASNALSQTDKPQTTNELEPIAAARCQYTPADHACALASDSAQARRSANNETTLTQLPRQRPRPPYRTGGPMGRPAYPGMWRAEGSPAHALIGTLIGFGLGAAVGAKGNIGVRGTLAFGAIGAGIGAGIGFGIPSFPSRRPYWHRWPSPDDEGEEASGHKTTKPESVHPNSPQQTASAAAAPSQPRPRADGVPFRVAP